AKRPPVSTSASVIRRADLLQGNPAPSEGVLNARESIAAQSESETCLRGRDGGLPGAWATTAAGRRPGGALRLAGGIVAAALEFSVAAGTHHLRLAAARTRFAGRLRRRRLFLALSALDVIAFRIQRAADELAQPAHAIDKPPVSTLLLALRAVLACFAHRDFDPGGRF